MLRGELLQYKEVTQIFKKQKADGVWGSNMLGVAPAKTQGIRAVGTVAQYRRLLELGVPPTERPFRLTERILFRLLSRDDDPSLLFEYRKWAKTSPDLAPWARDLIREAATTALAHAGLTSDPRVLGSAHRTASNLSQFLRSDLAAKPIIRRGSRNILHPEAHPPTIFSVATLAYIPGLQRERAAFVDRLRNYLTQPATRRTYVIQFKRKIIQPTLYLLGDPLQADSAGHPRDLPFALHWIELLVRLGMLHASTGAQRILGRLLRECDKTGVWSPKNLRALPKSKSKLADFAFPLEIGLRQLEQRKADVTFRLALIAKLAGWTLDFD